MGVDRKIIQNLRGEWCNDKIKNLGKGGFLGIKSKGEGEGSHKIELRIGKGLGGGGGGSWVFSIGDKISCCITPLPLFK